MFAADGDTDVLSASLNAGSAGKGSSVSSWNAKPPGTGEVPRAYMVAGAGFESTTSGL